jgi:starch synthase
MLSDGLTLALAAFDRLVEGGAQLLILGAEHPEQTEAIEFAARKHRGAIVRVSNPDDGILRRAMASADAIVLPSAVRPDAKVLLQAMRYGAVPVAMACGGIHQVVPPIDKNGAEGIGFFFYEPSVDALISAVRAMDAARQSTTVWNAIVSRAMRLDSSWAASAASLEGAYASLVARKKQRPAA